MKSSSALNVDMMVPTRLDGAGWTNPPGLVTTLLNETAIVSVTDAAGQIVQCNDRFCETTGYSRHELIGADHRLVNSGTHRPEVFRDLYSAILCGEIWRGALCNRRKDGSLYWLQTTIVPQLNEDGAPITFTSICFDISSLVQARDAFLLQTQEILTPLNGLLGIANALSETAMTARQREMTQLIVAAGQSLAQRLGNLLDMSMIGPGPPPLQRESLDPAIAGAVGAAAKGWPRPESGLDSVRILLAEDHPINRKVIDLLLAPTGADLTMVEDGAQALQRFRDEPFDLVLMDIQMPKMDGLTAIRQIRRIETLERKVRTPIATLTANTSNEHRRQAFAAGADAFIAKPVTAESLYAGVEALLAIQSKRAQTPIQSEVKSRRKRRALKPGYARPGSASVTGEAADHGPEEKSLLLLDDDRPLRELLASQLRAKGFEVKTAASVAEALEIARETLPAFAILDLHLEDGSGLKVCESLCQLRPESRVVMLSGYGSMATAVQAVKLGATDYLLKPTPADDLVDVLLATDGLPPEPPKAALSPALVRWEHIQSVLEDCGGHLSNSARRLGMHRRTLQRILSRGTPR